jgi:hypothetical protein
MTYSERLELRLDPQTRDAIERLRGDLSASEYLRRLVLADEVRQEARKSRRLAAEMGRR